MWLSIKQDTQSITNDCYSNRTYFRENEYCTPSFNIKIQLEIIEA